jgi:metal-sulfur cluster biosynthetic enzyme
MNNITAKRIKQALQTVIDPELGVDIVSLGLIYDVTVKSIQTKLGVEYQAHVVMTLTTPGCPLAPTIEDMIRQALDDIPGFDAYKNLSLELTFDPPWVPDMMDAETRAQLGLE